MSPTCEIVQRPFQVQGLTPLQSSLPFISVQLSGLNPSQRVRALNCLANLLMLAAVGADREANDDQR